MKTISDEYRKQQQKLHENPNYGVASISFAPLVGQIIEKFKIESVSDYGAGKQNLIKTLNKNGVFPRRYLPYDPAFPEYGEPTPAELVCCIDVLEHIEPELIDNVIHDLFKITDNIAFISIHMGPAIKVLEDGRNAHLIQKPTSWWLGKFISKFEVIQLSMHNIMGKGFWMIVKKSEF